MIDIDHESKTPLYQQIYAQLCKEIFSGAASAGSKLPPIRILAADLRVSRNTVETAYAQLAQEGFVVAHPGSGYIVQDVELMEQGYDESAKSRTKDFVEYLVQSLLWCNDDEAGSSIGSTPHIKNASSADIDVKKGRCYDFAYNNLPGNSFPANTWRKLTNEILCDPDLTMSAAYSDPLGERSLREQIARYLQVHRGVRCHPAQVVVQAGTQESLYRLLALFDPLHDVVAMEEPGYDGARIVFENMRYRLHPIPMYAGEQEQIDAYHDSHAKLAYVTPSHQFPTGKVLQLAARQALLNWARGNNAYLIEDDYCCEYRYKSRPLPALQSLDRHDRVIYMGTFSKTLSPSLRLSYLVLPPDLLRKWNTVFAGHYPSVPWINQAVLEAYMRQGHWERRIRQMQAANKRKYNLLKSSLQKTMEDQVDIMESGSGLHLLIGVRDGRGQAELIDLARLHCVKVYGTNRYWMAESHPLESYVLVGFSAIEKERIEPGVKRLAEAWFGKAAHSAG